MENNLRVHSTPVYLVEIQGTLANWSPDDYIQEASLSHCGTRFYVTTGGCGRSIGAKRCRILACRIIYLNKNHNNTEILNYSIY